MASALDGDRTVATVWYPFYYESISISGWKFNIEWEEGNSPLQGAW
jgi:hypothetical protein